MIPSKSQPTTNIQPVTKPEPAIRNSKDSDRSDDSALEGDLVKERSPLADLLYLRCKSAGSDPDRLVAMRSCGHGADSSV